MRAPSRAWAPAAGWASTRAPDYQFDSKGRLTDDGFVVELRIPFKEPALPGERPQSWGLNVKAEDPAEWVRGHVADPSA